MKTTDELLGEYEDAYTDWHREIGDTDDLQAQADRVVNARAAIAERLDRLAILDAPEGNP